MHVQRYAVFFLLVAAILPTAFSAQKADLGISSEEDLLPIPNLPSHVH
jgi:hypothetical protein